MKVINHDEEDKKQIFIMVGAVIVLVIIFVVIICFTHRSPDNSIEDSESETVVSTESLSWEGKESTEETEEESENEMEESSTAFPIEKREEYIDPILGLFAGKVNEAVEGFVFQNSLAANGAECLDCAVALDDPSNTEFYLQLNDVAGTLVTARYSPDTKGVTVTYCIYSLDEIKDEVWMTDGGPEIRDTTEEPVTTIKGKTIQGSIEESTQEAAEEIEEYVIEEVPEDATEYITEYIIEEETEIY